MPKDPGPAPEVLVLYRPRFTRSVARISTGNPHNPWREHHYWEFADTEKYDGYTDSRTGAVAFIEDHASTETMLDMHTVLRLAESYARHDSDLMEERAAIARLKKLIEPKETA